jgi:Rrf2 family nitric oxide-sensitive transcriptional repressor
MRLAEYTDYTLRVLMYCAAHPDERVTIAGLAASHGLSRNHLMKIVNQLARSGLLETTRGRGGGLRLRKDPASIRIGDVVRASETDFRLVECFESRTNQCSLSPSCRLKHVFQSALRAYFSELDNATLADIAGSPERAMGAGAVSVPLQRSAGRATGRATGRRQAARG